MKQRSGLNRGAAPGAVLLATGGAILLGMAACASAPVPDPQMAVAEASVHKANSTSTREYAGAELQRAVDKLAQAQAALVSKDYDGARRLAEEADVDAQVAELHAHAQRARRAADESREAARVLNDEIGRNPPR